MSLFVDIVVVIASGLLGIYALREGTWNPCKRRFISRITGKGWFVGILTAVAVGGGSAKAWHDHKVSVANAQYQKDLKGRIVSQSAEIKLLKLGQEDTHKRQEQANSALNELRKFDLATTQHFNGTPVKIPWKNVFGELDILKTNCPLNVTLHYELATGVSKELPDKNGRDDSTRNNIFLEMSAALPAVIKTVGDALGVKMPFGTAKSGGEIKLNYNGSPDFNQGSKIYSFDVIKGLMAAGVNPLLLFFNFKQLVFDVTPNSAYKNNDCMVSYYSASGT